MEILLKTQGLTKTFGKHKAVNNVNMHVERGDIYGFIGRNGAGKTTFLKMIGGLSSPTSGEISLFGQTGGGLRAVLPRVGVLIEAPGLFPNLTAQQNLALKCQAAGIKRRGCIEELLSVVGLGDVKHKKVGSFSLGMKQRLGIAMALVGDPELLLLDEPINGLDPQGIAEVRDTILQLNKERLITIIISSHILEELSKVATRYGIIADGELIEEIGADELMAKCCAYMEIRTDDAAKAAACLTEMGFRDYKALEGGILRVFERLEDIADVNTLLVTRGVKVSEIFVKNESLEEYFLKLTGGARHD